MRNEKIKLILENLNQGVEKLSEVQRAASKKIVKKLIKTTHMDPFNNSADATHVKKVLFKCKLIVIETDLDKVNKNLLSMLNFLENVIDMRNRGKSMDEIMKVCPDKLETDSELQKDAFKKKSFSRSDNIQTEDDENVNEIVSLKKDFECDLAELPSNYINGKIDKMSEVRISKIMEIKFIKNDNDSVSLTTTNLPKDVSKKEFKKLIKYTGLWLDKKTILRGGNRIIRARLIYSDSYITMLLIDKRVKIKIPQKIINQKIVMIQQEIINGKRKLKIVNFFNYANLKVKDIVKVKEMRKFIKKVNLEHNINLISNQCCIDDQNNFYHIGRPFTRN